MKKMFLAFAFVLSASPASARSGELLTYIDDCYTNTPGYLQCVGWAFGNGVEPDVVYSIGTCNGWCFDYPEYGALLLKESRPDVCNAAHSWVWSCNTDNWSNCPWNTPTNCVGYRTYIDLRSKAPGRYYARLVASHFPDLKGSHWLYVFDWDGTSASFVTWLETPYQGD